MSRSRLVASLAVITIVLAFGGRLAVQAFPLTVAADGPLVSAPPPVAPAMPVSAAAAALPGTPSPAPSALPHPTQESQTAASAETKALTLRVAQRAEPVHVSPPSEDATVVIGMAVDAAGAVGGRVELTTFDRTVPEVRMMATDTAAMERLIDQKSPGMLSQAQHDRVAASLDALRQWRFDAVAAPTRTAIGFNFARTEQSGLETEPIRIGGDVTAPAKLKDVRPAYPSDALAKGIQGVVILELVVDGAGIPVNACAIRPVDGVTMAAIQAALQWRFAPDPNYSRRLMTVTVNFALSGSVVGGVPGGVQGGVAGGVTALGGLEPAGPPPPPSGGAPVRVGGNIAQPTKVKDAAPVMPAPRSESVLAAAHPDAVRPGGAVSMPTEIGRSRPTYPPGLKEARVQGRVVCEVLVGLDGKVEDARVLEASDWRLEQAALNAAWATKFVPAMKEGSPVRAIISVEYSFRVV